MLTTMALIDINNVYFVKFKYDLGQNIKYNLKYELAYYYDGKPLTNKNGFMLSRIIKKNGKNRFYITERCIESKDYYDSDEYGIYYEENISYNSKYIGNNFNDAFNLFIE